MGGDHLPWDEASNRVFSTVYTGAHRRQEGNSQHHFYDVHNCCSEE